MLFMGEEWGASTPFQYFTDHEEPELAEAVRRGRAEEFGTHGWSELYGGEIEVPDPQSPETVAASRLDWSELDQEQHARVLDLYGALIHLRHTVPEIASGDRRRTSIQTGEGWIVMTREGERTIDVILTLTDGGVTVPLEGESVEVLLAWEPVRVDEDARTVTVHGHGVAVLRRL
jgi:maltooligosyltrehalose trehalohydrolase